MTDRAFIIGAGFNADVHLDAGETSGLKYPLLPDLLETCFGRSELPPGKSIEDLFQESLDERNPKPRERLADWLMRADGELAPWKNHARRWESNPYVRFLSAFPEDDIISFNYDGLLEITALQLRQWRPDDGFGVRVEVGPGNGQEDYASSSRWILHIHGSCYVMPQVVRIRPKGLGPRTDLLEVRDSPTYAFHPLTAARRFVPFSRARFEIPYDYPHERIVAPVPSKAVGFGERWVSDIYKLAFEALADVSQVVAIGYSFAEADLDSYRPLSKPSGVESSSSSHRTRSAPEGDSRVGTRRSPGNGSPERSKSGSMLDFRGLDPERSGCHRPAPSPPGVSAFTTWPSKWSKGGC